jgi:1,4-alpha-glucan branching enzyme
MSSHKERVEFKLMAPQAQQVFLSGSFNNWSAEIRPHETGQKWIMEKNQKPAPGHI